MSPRRADRRLHDVLAAAQAISAYLERGSLADGLIYDAVRVRLIEIGEAVKRHRSRGTRPRAHDPLG
ncbi:MAG: hypothetical protein ACRDTG_23730 [Pseudonocardiaceae bacterium]